MTQLSIVFEKILDSIHKVFTNIFDWIVAVFTAYLSWLGNDSGSFLLVLVALIWDMAWGIAAAVKCHNFVLSYLLRETFCKIIVYVGAIRQSQTHYHQQIRSDPTGQGLNSGESPDRNQNPDKNRGQDNRSEPPHQMAESNDLAGVCVHRDMWGWNYCHYYSEYEM